MAKTMAKAYANAKTNIKKLKAGKLGRVGRLKRTTKELVGGKKTYKKGELELGLGKVKRVTRRRKNQAAKKVATNVVTINSPAKTKTAKSKVKTKLETRGQRMVGSLYRAGLTTKEVGKLQGKKKKAGY